jgi:hypothetical protein
MIFLLLTASASASADSVDEMLAKFNKMKHRTKEKRGVKVEKYLEIRSELAVRSDRASYSGTYDVEGLDYELTLDVRADGTVTGRGMDRRRSFELRNGRLDGALLTVTKVYRDGTTEPMKGIFINRRTLEGRSPADVTYDQTKFGLGVTDVRVPIPGGIILDKLFYERQ